MIANPVRLGAVAALAFSAALLSFGLCAEDAGDRLPSLGRGDYEAVMAPVSAFAERWSAYPECAVAVPVNADAVRTAEVRGGSALTLRVGELGGGSVLFAVCDPDVLSSLSVERASVGGSDSLGRFLGHGVEVGSGSSAPSRWCAYLLDAPADACEALSATVRCVYPDGFEHVVCWGGGAE